MTDEQFEKLKTYIDSSVEWTEENFLENQQRLGRIYQKVLKILNNEKNIYIELDVEYKKIYGELFKKYKYNDNYAWEKKDEINSQIYSSKEFMDISIKLNKQKGILEYIEESLKNLASIPYHKRDYLEWLKWKSGKF